MVTRWGMSERVGTMVVEGRGSAGGQALNLRRDEGLVARGQTLAAGPDGRLLLNGGDLPAREPRDMTPDSATGETNSANMATVIDQEVQRLLSESYQTARALLIERREQLDRLACALMEREQLDRAAFEQLVSA
jgi:ATP-dependent Zn protease